MKKLQDMKTLKDGVYIKMADVVAIYAAYDANRVGALIVMSNHTIFLHEKRSLVVNEDGEGEPGPAAQIVTDEVMDCLCQGFELTRPLDIQLGSVDHANALCFVT